MSVEFIVVSALLALMPGTGVLFAITCGLSQGLRGAIWGAVAGALGVVPHVLAAGFGLTALLHSGSVLYEMLRIAGAIYLIYLAYGCWKTASIPPVALRNQHCAPSRIVSQGILLNLLNPKLTVFFLALLPQFLTPGLADQPTEIIAMGGVLIAETFVVFLIYGALAATFQDRVLSRPRLFQRCNQGFAVLFAGLGLGILAGAR